MALKPGNSKNGANKPAMSSGEIAVQRRLYRWIYFGSVFLIVLFVLLTIWRLTQGQGVLDLIAFALPPFIGAFVARNALAAVFEQADALAPRTPTEGLVLFEVGDRVASLLFDAGNGPGAYEMLLGRGRGPLPIALLVDLGVLPR